MILRYYENYKSERFFLLSIEYLDMCKLKRITDQHARSTVRPSICPHICSLQPSIQPELNSERWLLWNHIPCSLSLILIFHLPNLATTTIGPIVPLPTMLVIYVVHDCSNAWSMERFGTYDVRDYYNSRHLPPLFPPTLFSVIFPPYPDYRTHIVNTCDILQSTS